MDEHYWCHRKWHTKPTLADYLVILDPNSPTASQLGLHSFACCAKHIDRAFDILKISQATIRRV